MQIFLAVLFSGIIIAITVSSIIKVLLIAHRRKEISKRQFASMATMSTIVGIVVLTVLPALYDVVFTYFNSLT
ncbi:hypothetical protein JCM19055_4258 [Geomicrobium sp. JCM 19055]|nr:hypothetical protein JCM19055_4258 [Geomicrobium sp. JCM 19055]